MNYAEAAGERGEESDPDDKIYGEERRRRRRPLDPGSVSGRRGTPVFLYPALVSTYPLFFFFLSPSSKKAARDGGDRLPREAASGGPTALYLLGRLGLLPPGAPSFPVPPAPSDGEDPAASDPYFGPDPALVVDQLSRRNSPYLNPASVQRAICHNLERGKGEPMVTPNCLLDEEEADEVDAGLRGYDTDMICVTDEPYDELTKVRRTDFFFSPEGSAPPAAGPRPAFFSKTRLSHPFRISQNEK